MNNIYELTRGEFEQSLSITPWADTICNEANAKFSHQFVSVEHYRFTPAVDNMAAEMRIRGEYVFITKYLVSVVDRKSLLAC